MIRDIRMVAAMVGAYAALIWVMVSLAYGQDMPRQDLTPGAIASSDLDEICSTGYARNHRQTTDEMKDWVMREYGLTSRRDVEIDHRIPICLGGADVAANLWPQPYPEAIKKDHLEWAVCMAICADRHGYTRTLAPPLRLDVAQSWFLGDWREHLKDVGE
jgi:hypothetical protein